MGDHLDYQAGIFDILFKYLRLIVKEKSIDQTLKKDDGTGLILTYAI